MIFDFYARLNARAYLIGDLDRQQWIWRLRNPALRRLRIPILRVLYSTWLIQIYYRLTQDDVVPTDDTPVHVDSAQ